MEIAVITTDEIYRQILKRIDEIFDAQKGTEKGKELERLVALVEKYEEEHFSI